MRRSSGPVSLHLLVEDRKVYRAHEEQVLKWLDVGVVYLDKTSFEEIVKIG